MLAPAEVQQFQDEGFLVCAPRFMACSALMERCRQLVDSYTDLEADAQRCKAASSTNEPVMDEHYLHSSSNISFFLEDNAIDRASGKPCHPKEHCINTIGHALHDLDPVFRNFSRSEQVARLLKSLGYKQPLPVQSMYIFKQPNIGGEVLPHQDSTYIYTEPLSTIGLWWALEDSTKDNGCLWVLPGSHKRLGLQQRFMLKPDHSAEFDCNPKPYDLSGFVPLEVAAGTLVLLHGEVVHYSAPNTSKKSRHSYSMHVVEGAPGFSFPESNWLKRPLEMAWEPLYTMD